MFNFLKKHLFFVWPLLLLGSCVAYAADKQPCLDVAQIQNLAYSFNVNNTGQRAFLTIDLRIKLTQPCTAAEFTIELPNEYGPSKELYKHVSNLQVLDSSVQMLDTKKPYIKIIKTNGAETINLRYDLENTGELTPGEQHRPQIKSNYFCSLGFGLFVYPSIKNSFANEDPINVSLEWSNFPKNWNLANSHGIKPELKQVNPLKWFDKLTTSGFTHTARPEPVEGFQERSQLQSIPCYKQNFKATLLQLIRAVYTAGDFRILKQDCYGKPVYLAIRDTWPNFSDEQILERILKITAAEREFWNDFDLPMFLVTVAPLTAAEKHRSTGGLGVHNGFAFFITKNMQLNNLNTILAHEHFHLWNNGKIKQDDKHYKLSLWFSEGFTDYYAYVLCYRSGLITFKEYIDIYNTVLKRYYTCKCRNFSNEKIEASDWWADPDLNKLPYWKGSILAHNWNALIKQQTKDKHSIDDLMKDILAQANETQAQFSAKLFISCVEKYVNAGFADQIKKYVDEGQTIEPLADAFGDACLLAWEDVNGVSVPQYKIK